MADRPVVSVAMVTYNHRAFIGQAIESVLQQRRNFPIEIVISDDCSTDGTGEVIDRYQARHPELFVRCDPPSNVGGGANIARVWATCRGKYIAILEGDDWLHEDKLAVQVEFMEKHPECAFSGHSIREVDAAGQEGEVKSTGWPQIFDVTRLIYNCNLHTCSTMFRQGVIAELPAWHKDFPVGDWALSLLHGLHGKIGFIDRVLGYYRLHSGGTWSQSGQQLQVEKMLQGAQILRTLFPQPYATMFEGAIGQLHFQLFKVHRDKADFQAARWHLWQSCVHRFRARELTVDMLYKIPLRMLFPQKW